VGRFAYQKGVDILLNAYKKSILSRCGILLVVIGDDQKNISKSSSANITIYKCLPRHEVLELMRTSLILVVPSRFEERGTVIGEALALGTSVLASDLSSLRCAYLNAPREAINYFNLNEVELTQALNNIVDSSLKVTLKKRYEFRKYAQNFNSKEVVKQYLKLYRKLL